MQITKGQHFVWRKYLENWCTNGELFIKELNTERVFNTNPKNILKENFIYKIPILAIPELTEIEAYVKQLSSDSSKDLNLIFFNVVKKIAFLNIATLEKENFDITPYSKEGLEDFYTRIEKYGRELVSVKSATDLESLLKGSLDQIKFFVLFQYMRTQNMRNNLRNLIKSDDKNIRLAKELLTPIILVNNIICSSNETLNFTILNNQTDVPLITSDQPASNIKGNELDGNGNIKELVLMYPINPKLSLIIDFTAKTTKAEMINCDKEDILYYNNQVKRNSSRFLISIDSNTLEVN